MVIAKRLSLLVLLTLAFAPVAEAHPGSGIAVTSDGRVIFVDTGAGVFSIERDGRIVRREGRAYHWFALDPAGRFRRTRWPSVPNADFETAGSDPTVILSSDFPVVVGTDWKFYVPAGGHRDGRIRLLGIDPSGKRTVRAILPPIERGGETVTWLNGLAAGPSGSIFYTEDDAVHKVDARGRVSTVASRVTVPRCARIPADEDMTDLLPYLRGLAVASDGSIYVAASGCGAVLRIARDGATSVVLRTTPPWSPTAVAVANGEVFVLEYLHTPTDDRREWLPRVRKIGRKGDIRLLGGIRRR